MLLKFFLRVESSSREIGNRDHRHAVIADEDHWHEKLPGMEELFSPRANDAAALGCAGHLGEVHDAKMRFRVMKRVAGKSAGHGFGTGHTEIVQVVSLGGMGKVRVDHAHGEIGAISSDSVEMVFVFW